MAYIPEDSKGTLKENRDRRERLPLFFLVITQSDTPCIKPATKQ
ncbi:hypothetical protein HMPREF9141_0519 [Prevotella multiformis DSM 16608]|uniref:Uncharacterized protein n=1 Tax=Prevotella multiformis DSM 16608 TaxID=888743 RepID=F0F4K3_9BACT|nr:hypothetical protein HMPREF9141_0519 [Prevotella multiformis DSM 16608]